MTEDEFRSKKIEPSFDYMAEADKTCSTMFRASNVDKTQFVSTLTDMMAAAETLNLMKKLLFRGKSPRDLDMPWPAYEASIDFKMNWPNGAIDLIHGLVGVLTEAGEMAELLIKWVETGELDPVNVVEECGDVSWYMVRQLRGISDMIGKPVTIDDMHRVNIDKLHNRHGDAYNMLRDHNRTLEVEHAKMSETLDFDVPTAQYGERSGPIGDCEGMDC